MTYENRQTFGLSTITALLHEDGSHIVTLGDATSLSITPNRTSVNNQTSSGVNQGEHTSMWEPEVAISGVMSLTPSARRIIDGSALISGTDAAITGMPAARVIDSLSGDWSATTFTTDADTVPGVYRVESTAASTAVWTNIGKLKGSPSVEDVVQTTNAPTSSNYPTTGIAIVSVEPVVDARGTYVGGRPGSNPPIVSLIGVSDPSTYSSADERNAKAIYVPRAVCTASPLTMTAREISTADMTFKAFYDDGIDGHWQVTDLLGIAA